ncbi:pyridoxal phosphate-dependent aminotransferase [Rufibacter glacialis]|uniref:Aminotransferase n=1 Tax=Rufibacter glacialis TaxID=1259555 RepID=A0A5M8QEK2_9BACT|nr:aminotransferase class I/II-fold pyridoxal phosphate-dependent enzyme [Rufibacter glacialis]KAA6434467.1 aminotransferase class I/II-fold pyridoxal phosphate-dependent enzyme [Rufibacter glacialis]GGK69869.1 aminotransferase [Rufibacter glacialis]
MIIPSADRLQQVQEYYFSRKLAEVRALNAQGRNIINLGIGDPDMDPSEETVQALVNTSQTAGVHGYQPYNSIAPLRQAIARWYQQTYAVELDPEKEILPLMGSKEGIFHVSMAFLNPGDKVLVPNPGYPAYAATAKLVGAVPVAYTLKEENGWLPDPQELQELLAEGGVKLMWVNYPHMPTGAEATAEALQNLVQLALEHQFLLANDNPYSLVLPHGKPLSLLSLPQASECCLEFNSLSKSHNMAGWRVGMVLGRQDYLQNVLRVKSNLDSGMFQPVQHAAIKALSNPESWHQARNAVYAQRRQKVYELLELLGCSFQKNAVGMFVWARVPQTVTDVEAFLDEILYEAGVFLTPGKIFGTQGERYLRVSLCLPENKIEEATNRISTHLTSAKPELSL